MVPPQLSGSVWGAFLQITTLFLISFRNFPHFFLFSPRLPHPEGSFQSGAFL